MGNLRRNNYSKIKYHLHSTFGDDRSVLFKCQLSSFACIKTHMELLAKIRDAKNRKKVTLFKGIFHSGIQRYA